MTSSNTRGVFAHLAAFDDPLFIRRGHWIRDDRAHGGRGAVGTRAHGIGVGGMFGAVARGRAHGVGRRRPHGGSAPVAVASQRRSGAPGRIRAGDPIAGGHRGRRHGGQPAGPAARPVTGDRGAGIHRRRTRRCPSGGVRARHHRIRLVPSWAECPGRQHRLHPAARRGGGHRAALGQRSAGGPPRRDDHGGRHQRCRLGSRSPHGTP